MKGSLTIGTDLKSDVDVSCDIAIVGSGAGGAVLAAGLVERGLNVIVLEEGGYFTRADFDGDEAKVFPMMYQDRGTRTTADLAITILQGRTVGGSTTINWTTCFRTPDRILEHWTKVHGIEGWDPATMVPHFEAVEERLGIEEWPLDRINANNDVLYRGCTKLGWEVKPLRRNVRGCVDSGYCGMGCPTGAKQAMHRTYLQDGLDLGLTIHADVRADRIELDAAGTKVETIHASVLDRTTGRPTGVKVTVRPKVAVSACGAINGPAFLLRSGIDQGPVGRRTFLHPVIAVPGFYERVINPFFGAPQSVGSHEFYDRGPDKVGFFLEAPPIHPILASLSFAGFGLETYDFMSRLPHLSAQLAIHVDGLHPDDDGGTVSLRADGRIRVDYPVRGFLQEAMQASHLVLAKIHFAAGAKEVIALHHPMTQMNSLADLPKLAERKYGSLEHQIFTAHQMGGCAMGPDPATSVVDLELRHHTVKNLFVVDGSVFPTSLGVNPSETIYGIAHKARDAVASAV
jgi:choline dehydrogenase-like flavoprotein